MPGNYKNILIIDLAFIGDVVLATPVTRALAENFPGARLTMMTVPLTATVAAMNPYVSDVMIYDKHGADSGPIGMWRVAGRIRERSFDLAVSMNFAVRGAIVSRLAKVPSRLGYDARHAGYFLTHVASSVRDGIKHESLNHLEVLQPLGITTADSSLALAPPEEAVRSLDEKCERLQMPRDGYLAFSPVGSYARKNLSLATTAHVVRHFSRRRPIFLIGGRGEAAELSRIADVSHLSSRNVLAGTLTLPELAVFLKRAAALITVDTGPLHIAQAVGCRTIAIFGPTDPVVWGPRGKDDVTLYHGAPCSPCWGRGPCDLDMICIEGTTAREIISAVEARL